MRIGLGLYPDEPARRLLVTAQLAERLGYAALWVADSQLLWRELYALLGAIAAMTGRIALGSAVTNPLTRHPSVTASAFRTLCELAGGRLVLGIGLGDSAAATLGLRPARLAALGAAIDQLRRLFDGGLGYGEGRPIPIYVAASAPRMLALAGRLADGVILMNGVASDLVGAAIERVRAAAAAAKRDPGAIRIVVWSACHPSAGAVKFNVARTILRDLPGPIDELTRATAALVRARYDYAQHGAAGAAFAALIPDELVSRFAFAGPPQAIASQIEALARIGVDEVALAVPSAADLGRDAVIAALADRLLPWRG